MVKLTQSANILHVVLALAVSAVVVSGAMDGVKLLKEKRSVQESNTNLLVRWKSSYIGLTSSIEQWQKTYMSTKDVPDIDAIGALIDLEKYGLIINLDKLTVKSAKTVEVGGMGLDMTKLCIGSGTEYLTVSALNYPALLDGLAQIVKRRDIHVDAIEIGSDTTLPQARIRNFCVYLRND